MSVVVFSTVIGGCARSAVPTRAEAREACGVDADTVVTAATEMDDTRTLDVACATTLGDVIALDWDSFAAVPGPVSAADGPVFPVLVGVLAFVSLDLGTVDELTAAPGTWEWSRDALAAAGEDTGFDPTDPAGELVYDWVTTRIHHTVLNLDLDAGGRYRPGGVVQLPPEEALDASPPIWVASVLVHEASHADGPLHVACDGGGTGCDADLDGVYGAQALALDAIRAHLDPDDPRAASACAEVQNSLSTVCGMVNDTQGAGLCEREALEAGCAPWTGAG